MFRCIFIFLCFVGSQNIFAATVLIWGDSLSAGYGVAKESSWSHLLEQRLKEKAYSHTLVNASISGETSAGGLARLPAALAAHKPSVVILELGANDGLRGLDINAMRSNLEAMVLAIRKTGAKVLLIGMRMPPNFGPFYTQKFQATFSDLAKKHKLAFLPFMLEGFADKPDLFQSDGLHPQASAQQLVLDNIWPHLQVLLK